MRQLPILIPLAALLLCLLPACEVENCPPNALSFACFTLKDGNGKNVSFSTPLTVVGIKTAGGTTVCDTLINQESGASRLSLPLSYADETRFVLRYSETEADTVTVRHRNIPHFLNIDCGTMMFHEVTHVSTTRHAIDSIVLTNPNIDNYEKENVKIYFPPVSAE